MTEQGEVIHRKYGCDDRHAQSRTDRRGGDHGQPGPATGRSQPVAWRMARLSELARGAYRDLVYGDETFATTSARHAHRCDRAHADRLAPGLARKKDRHFRSARHSLGVRLGPEPPRLPGWYGLGSGLEALIEESVSSRSRTWRANWLFLANLLEDAEMAMAKADMDIAQRYAGLAGELGERYFPAHRGRELNAPGR
jgi:phosphoenolpyruvate carboxylase